ncbi:hypothetical protein YC2023_118518 [Brassica napus]
MDWTAIAKPLEEMQRSWLLQSSTLKNKKTYVKKKKIYAWTLAFIGVLVEIMAQIPEKIVCALKKTFSFLSARILNLKRDKGRDN